MDEPDLGGDPGSGRDALFESAAAYSDTRFDLAQGGEARLRTGRSSRAASFFDVLGRAGRCSAARFTLDDDRRGGGAEGPVAVISYAFWQRRYGGAADAVGRTLVLNGVPVHGRGRDAAGFFGPTVGRSFDVAVPIGMVDRVQSFGGGGSCSTRAPRGGSRSSRD